jgi:outer membrane autotransporter protein
LARNQIDSYEENGAGTLNLGISNEHANFLEGRVGFDLLYQGLKIIKPQIKLSYGYDFLNSDQSSTNHFQGQSSSFQIKNSNIDKSSFKYGVGLNIYQKAGFLLDLKYDVEVKSSYKSKVGSVYLRYDF